MCNVHCMQLIELVSSCAKLKHSWCIVDNYAAISFMLFVISYDGSSIWIWCPYIYSYYFIFIYNDTINTIDDDSQWCMFYYDYIIFVMFQLVSLVNTQSLSQMPIIITDGQMNISLLYTLFVSWGATPIIFKTNGHFRVALRSRLFRKAILIWNKCRWWSKYKKAPKTRCVYSKHFETFQQHTFMIIIGEVFISQKNTNSKSIFIQSAKFCKSNVFYILSEIDGDDYLLLISTIASSNDIKYIFATNFCVYRYNNEFSWTLKFDKIMT